MTRNRIRLTAVVGTAAVLFGLSTAPAFAAGPPSLPSGNTLFALNCVTEESGASAFPDLQLFAVATSNAASTLVGSGSDVDESQCAWQGAWDAKNSTAYVALGSTDTAYDVLATVNLSTGVTTKVGDLTIGGESAAIDSFAIGTDGTAYATLVVGGTTDLATVDLSNGHLTNAITTEAPPDAFGLAVDPVTGDFYFMRVNGDFSKINVVDGSVTDLGTPTGLPDDPQTFSLQIDANENAWIEVDSGSGHAQLWSFPLADPAAIPSGTLQVEGTSYYTQSLLLTPTPAAAKSGTTSKLYAIACDGSTPDLRFYSVNKSNAIATLIGNGADINSAECAGQAAWDAVSHTAYYVTYGEPQALASVNVSTGNSTKVADFTLNGDTFDGSNIDAIAIGTDGSAFAIARTGDGVGLYSLSLSTGALTFIGAMDEDSYGFAVDPKTGDFYTINDSGVVSRVDVTTGAQTTIGTVVTNGGSAYTYSMQIDTDGTFWVENDGDGEQAAELWTFTLADLASGDYLGDIGTGSVGSRVNFYTESLLLVPASATSKTSGPSLAFTGGVDGTDVGMGAGAASIVLIVGGLLLAVSRRRRRARG